MGKKLSYGSAICAGFQYLLKEHPEVFAIGQGLWSPWYVGNSMKDLERDFGKTRIIDSPVSELACTGAALGASLCGYRPIIIHPRMDFMVLAADQLINQASKWHSMLGGQASAPLTIRGIINRGREQGAQHSQALHSMYAHIPGLRVVMPATVADARDLLIASVLSDDPVLYIDDRWLYTLEDELSEPKEIALSKQVPVVRQEGSDITLVGASYSYELCRQAGNQLAQEGIHCELIDLRVVNPLDYSAIVASVEKTKRLCVVDGSWANCGLAGEIIAGVAERVAPSIWASSPKRITLPDAPAPTSKVLEDIYYTKVTDIVNSVKAMVCTKKHGDVSSEKVV